MEGFKIIGISVRTTNKNNQAQKDLGKLWREFYSGNIMDKIPNKKSGEVLSVYTDYVSDYTDEYTVIIGSQVKTLDNVPEGFVGREFPSENFKKVTAKGALPDAVGKTWADIWQKDKELNRKYTYDYEVYGEQSQNGEHSEVEIFIAIN